MSWNEAFTERYDEWAAHMTADVAFYVSLARMADGPVVELAVGTGRVAIPVAAAIGRRVIGIDGSPGMLERCSSRAAEAGVELDLVRSDMRELRLSAPAALIYCPFRALLHLPTWADKRAVFERVHASLRPGGRFAWNALAGVALGKRLPQGLRVVLIVSATPLNALGSSGLAGPRASPSIGGPDAPSRVASALRVGRGVDIGRRDRGP